MPTRRRRSATVVLGTCLYLLLSQVVRIKSSFGSCWNHVVDCLQQGPVKSPGSPGCTCRTLVSGPLASSNCLLDPCVWMVFVDVRVFLQHVSCLGLSLSSSPALLLTTEYFFCGYILVEFQLKFQAPGRHSNQPRPKYRGSSPFVEHREAVGDYAFHSSQYHWIAWKAPCRATVEPIDRHVWL